MKTTIGHGVDGRVFANIRDLKEIRSLLEYPQQDKNFCAAHSSVCTAPPDGTLKDTLLAHVRNRWRAALSARPQASWLRRFGTISNKAPFTNRETPSFYHPSNPCSEPTTTWTLHPIDNKPSHPNSFEPFTSTATPPPHKTACSEQQPISSSAVTSLPLDLAKLAKQNYQAEQKS